MPFSPREKTGSLAATGIPSAVAGNSFNLANEMTSFNGTPLTYDLNGNLLNDGSNSYTWDARNHLSTLTASGMLPTTASFVYDALGRRFEKTINQQTTAFLYDGWNPVQELAPSGLGQFAPTANMLTGLGIDEFFQRSDVNGAQSFISDALASTLALANAAGSISTSYTYEPFGNVSINPSATNTNPYQFTGRENDGTGLYFYRARYYSFAQQRFTAQDPLEFNGGSSDLYVYVVNDPTNLTDPSGQGIIDCVRLLSKLPSLLKAQQDCQRELDRCDDSSDDLFKFLDSQACKQDFCKKYGAPSNVPLAVATCACQKAGEGKVCVDFLENGWKCSY